MDQCLTNIIYMRWMIIFHKHITAFVKSIKMYWSTQFLFRGSMNLLYNYNYNWYDLGYRGSCLTSEYDESHIFKWKFNRSLKPEFIRSWNVTTQKSDGQIAVWGSRRSATKLSFSMISSMTCHFSALVLELRIKLKYIFTFLFDD
jgi:hypothetical protein